MGCWGNGVRGQRLVFVKKKWEQNRTFKRLFIMDKIKRSEVKSETVV